MRVVVAAVGRLKAGPERELVARYLERAGQMGRGVALGPPEVVELDESRARRPDDRKRDEAAALLAALDPKLLIYALDEGGRSPSSEAFAADLGRRRDDGAAGVAFVIGGADGLAPEFLARATARLAFGAMTWPHQIVRVLLAEQLYRASTILAGHPYHRV
ncbi:ribosomal RNA large subunit methyltransferase H [Methylopila jiangsuensis]|uniref:Ribosomal RNA large subunit methyltransferase H n=1 Tax=Methylopila jiangsuensis TaxID=586230 RepID=A0A9W6N537_9HYPH|nr:23S rRNA (pseudouridine(1915)-N(3))-methyltransferase RlmH [Methylopila jiangsuensis]MDR6284644.1 23S rRNA (pseudouridine1915-N3)-methyltransferase [Methylopila jiangsuensis]GLK77968.1 ribosomal RNA large subunit methyltransferase H [Methylopila jiangsuensis]